MGPSSSLFSPFNKTGGQRYGSARRRNYLVLYFMPPDLSMALTGGHLALATLGTGISFLPSTVTDTAEIGEILLSPPLWHEKSLKQT